MIDNADWPKRLHICPSCLADEGTTFSRGAEMDCLRHGAEPVRMVCIEVVPRSWLRLTDGPEGERGYRIVRSSDGRLRQEWWAILALPPVPQAEPGIDLAGPEAP